MAVDDEIGGNAINSYLPWLFPIQQIFGGGIIFGVNLVLVKMGAYIWQMLIFWILLSPFMNTCVKSARICSIGGHKFKVMVPIKVPI